MASERGHDEQDTNGNLQRKRKRGRPRKVSSPKAPVRTENEEEETDDEPLLRRRRIDRDRSTQLETIQSTQNMAGESSSGTTIKLLRLSPAVIEPYDLQLV